MESDKLAEAVRQTVLHVLNSKATEIPDSHMLAQYVSAESSDSNLSTVRMADGNTLRGVPKTSSVGSLSANDTIILATPRSSPAVIIGRVVGDFANFSV